MSYIKGKIRQIIYESESGYKVGIIKVKETNDNELKDYLNKTITFTGYFVNLNFEDNYILKGNLVFNEKYGYQFKVSDYEKEEIKGKEAVKEFLASPLIKGCGEKTAKNIVDTLGEDAINIIKKNSSNLLMVKGMSEKKALKIYESIIKYQSTDDMILKFKSIGLSINDALTIINKYGDSSMEIFETNPYSLSDLIDFKKIDAAYIKTKKYSENVRNMACIEQVIKYLEIQSGSTYFNIDEIFTGLEKYFNISITYDKFINYLNDLVNTKVLTRVDNDIALSFTNDLENYIANRLIEINNKSVKNFSIFETEIIKLQDDINVKYNKEQLSAIKNALENRVSIISGGPGTGKTTIIKAIVDLYIKLYNLNTKEVLANIALLAPTGRAAKKLSASTSLPASTIHRYLKWNKESNDFGVCELNPNYHKLIIVDETSMIDTYVFASLLKGLTRNIQIVFVGDANQLPSVGPGMILNDLISSNLFSYNPLNQIYRQSVNSYIPVLAQEIKNKKMSDFTLKKDDYNFLSVSSSNIKSNLKKICQMCIEKGLDEDDIQILAPMYKGENGIDNLNVLLRDLFNPKDSEKKEIKIGDRVFREDDKVLQLVNNIDKNVFNGDIGYIRNIISINHPRKKDVILIDFDGNILEYSKEDMYNIIHAYAITIHKSQGSEFSHVIIPIVNKYNKMLYNKLIYTAVSRAKKSLVILGEEDAFIKAVNSDLNTNRKTTLLDKLMNNI